MSIAQELELARRALPEVAAATTQILVDNPAQFALVTAGTLVATKILMNLVRPRNMVEALAVVAVVTAGAPYLVRAASDRGLIRLRFRDLEGNLVDLAQLRPSDAPGA